MINSNLVVYYKLSNPCVTLETIGTKFGVTRERIRQILEENNVSTQRPQLPKWLCSCGKPIYEFGRRFCSSKCKFEYFHIPLVCTTCGTIFYRKKSLVIGRHSTPRYKNLFQFCSRKCRGIHAGNNYGFKAHPENRGYKKGTHRKYDYNMIWATYKNSNSKAEVARKLNMPYGTVYRIIKEEDLHDVL